MSRFYRVVISDPADGGVYVPNFQGNPGYTKRPADPTLSTYTSLNAGALVSTIGGTNRAALRFHCDMPVTVLHQPGGDTMPYVQIDGVSLAEYSQIKNLQRMNIAVYGGMAAGLPLASPSQAGIICSGQVYQGYGNWVGTEMSISLFISNGSSPSSNQTTGHPSGTSTTPLPATNASPANISFTWVKGQPLIDALTNALQTPFPKYPISASINPNLVWTSDQASKGVYATLPQFAQFIHQKSLSVVGGYAPDQSLYPGVSIALQKGKITIYDNTAPLAAKLIRFEDLIGQPGRLDPFTLQAAVVMRADIEVGSYVTMPAGPTIYSSAIGQVGVVPQATTYSVTNGQFSTQVQQTTSNTKNGSDLQGTYIVTAIRHIGDSRQAAGEDWVTVLDMLSAPPPTKTYPPLPTVFTGNPGFTFFTPAGI